MEDSIKRLKDINDENAQRALANAQHDENQIANIRLQETVVKSFEYLIGYLEDRVSKTVIVNQLREIGTPDALEVVKAVDSLHNTLKTHENTDLSELTGIMQSILDETKQIPKENVEIPEEQAIDYSEQLESLEDAIKAIETAVKEQKLNVEAPVVNVPETQVNVDAPDLKPLTKEITDKFTKAIKGIVFPEYKVDTSILEKEQKKQTKLLKEIVDKPVGGGGGGGGSSWTYVNSEGIPVPPTLTASGAVPVDIQDASITISGDVTVSNEVEVKNDTGNPIPVGGNVASGATDSGNPIKAGGVFNTTNPTVTTGQRVDLQTDSRGNLKIIPASGSNTASFGADNADTVAVSTTSDKQRIINRNSVFNGNEWDRLRSNESVTLLASAARTTTQTSADLLNYNGLSNIDVILDVTSAGSGSITVSINGKDPASGKYYNLLTGAAVVTNVTNVYRVGLGNTVTANASANYALPRTFQIVVTANNANSITYSVGYNLSRAT